MALAAAPDGLLFSLSSEKGLEAEVAGGQAGPVFATPVRETDGVVGKGLAFDGGLALAWPAAGNIYARRGTISFFFRPRTSLGRTPFPLFRVASADSTSWDMQFLRIDWNGHGLDAFVTDTGLARTRVSYRMEAIPAADQWVNVTFAWDEREGVKLWIDGKPVAQKEAKAVYDQGLWGFGPFQRIVAPWQVHSLYNYRRTGDLDELRIYDHMVSDADAAALAVHQAPHTVAQADGFDNPRVRDDWYLRYGWNRPEDPPLYLSNPVTAIRKVEFSNARDLKEKNFKGADGIRETTWPGVYNRSRLPGRHDYFELPDWNVYSSGGKTYTLTLPDEPWNHLEINGPAYGEVIRTAGDGQGLLFARPQGQERTSNTLKSPLRGGEIAFVNTLQETPIEEIGAYYIKGGAVPEGYTTLSYMVDAQADPAFYPALTALRGHIAGRYLPAERAEVVALPKGAPRRPETGNSATVLPIVHVLIPGDFRSPLPGSPPTRFSYGWENLNAGLDGIALDLPALNLPATHKGLIPLNIRVKDPTWPDRDLLDINVSVKPGEARTLWLDTRDRLLPAGTNIYLTVAAAAGGFDAKALNGMKVRLVFKPADAAKPEHIADRLEQARDNLSFLVEEQPNIRLYPLWDRFERDITDVLRVDPDNKDARAYWVEKNPEQPYGPYRQTTPPAGVPLWAFRQSEDLKLYRRFVDWWIDNRQIENGEFGGGLSDDTDLVNQWVPLALMGVEPDKIIKSQEAVTDATFANGMWSGGLSRIHADELHSYEEGINAVAQSMQIDWGNPQAIERGMAVAREYPRLIQANSAGHLHFVSSYYSGTDIDRDDGLGVQRPDSLLITHPGLLLVDYNGNPQTRSLLLGLLDGWLAHGEKTAKGWTFPTAIDWQTDQGTGHGVDVAAHDFWAAYSWTGDDKYLRPLDDALHGGLSGLSNLNADVLAQVAGGTALAQRISSGADQAVGGAIDRNLGGATAAQFARFIRWQQTGDNAILADLYGEEIEGVAQRMPVLTSAELWVDRVSVPGELLQRTRLGGVAHRRMAFYPGNLVSWRFSSEGEAVDGEDVAIQIPKGDPKAFNVIAYNLTDRPVTAHMTGAQLAAGTWRLASAEGARQVTLERGRTVDLLLPPHQEASFGFRLKTPGDDPATRPDIGISNRDVSFKGRTLSVTVHSLGARPTPAGTVLVIDGAGHEVAQGRFGSLAAPTDLTPKTVQLKIVLPRGADTKQVRLRLDGAPDEITQANNSAVTPGA
ncbi:LamG-like jellyroll fold domain-containing protein [Asticcacaulis taihuensis]|uniref:LamG-like jellyroll fold domain-containing protein n=1 Tax=Asticcacaulis taihuensis TaxID=260084 RepID=UPI003F7BA811